MIKMYNKMQKVKNNKEIMHQMVIYNQTLRCVPFEKGTLRKLAKTRRKSKRVNFDFKTGRILHEICLNLHDYA